MTRHVVIPDTQIRPEDDTAFLTYIAKYICDMKPDVIVHLGDFADMASLSSYDAGKKSFEGRRYSKDIEAANKAWDVLNQPIEIHRAKLAHNKKKVWNPRKVIVRGNHEHRIERCIENDPKLDGVISSNDLAYHRYGWEDYPFLQPVVINGICYCHYFTSGVLGRAIGSANLMVNKLHMSSIAGHQQGRQVAYGKRADGQQITCIIAGSCYEHEEDYLGPQGNKHFHGIIVLNEVQDGSFDEMFVSLSYLKNKYGN